MQTDSVGYLDSINLYQYCGNNPVNYSDPLGLYEDIQDILNKIEKKYKDGNNVELGNIVFGSKDKRYLADIARGAEITAVAIAKELYELLKDGLVKHYLEMLFENFFKKFWDKLFDNKKGRCPEENEPQKSLSCY